MYAGGRFTSPALDGMVLSNVNTLRELRRSIGLKQEEFALLLQVPLETLRTWDSGRRAAPACVFAEAKHVVADRPRQMELLSSTCWPANSASTNGHCARPHGPVASSWSSR